jgi:mannitol/fructose-specific phosphotransferase system IIA component (Ntr-type)
VSIVLAISSVPVAARALYDLRIAKTDLGFLIMSALSVNDLIGWLIFTFILALFSGRHLDVFGTFGIMAVVLFFTAVCLMLGRPLVSRLMQGIRRKNFPEPGTSFSFIVILGLICGTITMKVGIHALFGFFIAGIMAGQSDALPERTRQIISQVVHSFLVPLFFAGIGLRVNFITGFDLPLVLLFCTIGIGGRFLGAFIGLLFSGVPKTNRTSVAIAHIPGGPMEIVVAILALQFGLITEQVFVAVVIAAVVSSIVLGPWLGYTLRRRARISVLEFFTRGGIAPSLKETDRDEAIERLCILAAEQEGIPAEKQIYDAVLTREHAAGTGMEEGVAVPHARLPMITKPLVIVGRSLSGIDWNSPDGKTSHFIFLILTPQQELESQVQILASIARVMSDRSTRENMLRAPDAQAIWRILHDALGQVHIYRRQKA